MRISASEKPNAHALKHISLKLMVMVMVMVDCFIDW